VLDKVSELLQAPAAWAAVCLKGKPIVSAAAQSSTQHLSVSCSVWPKKT
jgi:hypothetical protein